MVYKTLICKYPTVNGQCKEKGKFCPFSHGDLRKPSPSHFSVSNPLVVEEKKLIEPIFVLDTFKIHPCKLNTPHDRVLCTFYHDNKDYRRDPIKYNYCAQRCSRGFNADYRCNFKDKCRYVHNEIEELYHKDVYQTKICKSDPCKLGEKCPYSHYIESPMVENIQESLKKYIDANSVLKAQLDEIQLEMEELNNFKCIFCNTEVAEAILMCGHLTCPKCFHGDSCVICFSPIYPIIDIKLL